MSEYTKDRCNNCGSTGFEDGCCMECGKPRWMSAKDWIERKEDFEKRKAAQKIIPLY